MTVNSLSQAFKEIAAATAERNPRIRMKCCIFVPKSSMYFSTGDGRCFSRTDQLTPKKSAMVQLAEKTTLWPNMSCTVQSIQFNN
jgi:hypothetical protein